jgi:hypothetical protein
MIKSLKRKKHPASNSNAAPKKPRVKTSRISTEERSTYSSANSNVDNLLNRPSFNYNAEQDDISFANCRQALTFLVFQLLDCERCHQKIEWLLVEFIRRLLTGIHRLWFVYMAVRIKEFRSFVFSRGFIHM